MTSADNNNFFALLANSGFADPTAEFLTLSDRRWTYGEIDALSARIADALYNAGLRPGDRVTAQVEKSAENVALYLASLRGGFVYTPLNTAYTEEEVAYFLDDGEPSVFVCAPDREEALSGFGPAHTERLTLDAQGNGSLMSAARRADPRHQITTRHTDDLAVILYTSGTTGRSKGAMLTHGSLAANALALQTIWEFSKDDVLLHALPIFHIHGLFVALHTAILAGARVLFLKKFTVTLVRGALTQATVMMGVPTFYSRLLDDPDFNAHECRALRLAISGSAPMTVETHRAFEKCTGCQILERYGMSEAGIITSNPLNGARIAGTVGYALPGYDLRIVDDKGAPVPTGEAGALEVRGPSVFKGYWRMPEKTAADFRDDGWFITGDIGSLDDDGRLTLSGRAKDMIISGGYNIYPKEIEQVLDAVDGVMESAVIGAPHADMGEGVVAVLAVGAAAPPKEAAIDQALSVLAPFKRPRHIAYVEALPRNAMSKVQKQLLKKTYADIFARP